MNKWIGPVRQYVAALSLAAAAVASAIWAAGLNAERQKLAMEARRLSTETDALYLRAGEVEAAAARARRDRTLYDTLQDRGFSRPSVPADLASILAVSARGSDVGRLVYDIGAEPRLSPRWQGARSVPVTLDLWATTDSAVVDFLADLSDRVDGALRVGALTIERTGDIDAAVLAAARRGDRPPLVRAQAALEWSTMPPVETEAAR